MMRKHHFHYFISQASFQIFVSYVCIYICIGWCSRLCKPGTLDPTKVKGKILVCLRGNKLTSASEGEQGKLAGAVAVLVQNDDQNDNLLLAENHILPAASISGTGSHNIKNGTGNNGNNK